MMFITTLNPHSAKMEDGKAIENFCTITHHSIYIKVGSVLVTRIRGILVQTWVKFLISRYFNKLHLY